MVSIYRGTKPNIELRSRLVHLRPLNKNDVSQKYLGWLHDPDVNRFLEVRFNLPDMEELKAFVQGFNGTNGYLFGVFTHDQNKSVHIGNFIIEINPFHKTAYFGYLIGDKKYWGSSAATEAIVLILEFAFEIHEVRRVWGGAYDSNFASAFNFHRFGFIQEGALREHHLDGDEPVDGLFFGLLRAEWKKKREEFRDIPVEIHLP